MVKPDIRTQQWLAGGVIILLSVLVWVVYFYVPLKDKKNEIASECTVYRDRIKQLDQRLKKLNTLEKTFLSKKNGLTRFSKIMIYGKSIDDINAETQILFQTFFEKNDITLTSYKVLSGSKWKNYDLGRVEFNIVTSMTGLDKILKYAENLDKVVRIENLNINYTAKRTNPLRVNLRMETLFLDIGTGKGS